MSYVLNEEQVRRVLASDGYPVTKITQRDEDGVYYSVVAGGAGGSDFENALGVWDLDVEFGHDERHRAGGPAFVEAAQEQEAVADAVVALLEEMGR